ncbi:predicted protein [Naegleria gruberi]|uniref:Predicted protein n=1 Tax=Naegleria gruberi TaxID=5762 RepID=D2VSA7_NAEGR|nr:uncharacterized protein NAEGRDRAFT_71873 [Naegleria gruberi]EFC40390.1 predicted protein [Naegleria gruberi]|eukprot:XP_002673134.1 predicted protein [Naegleria gruberi strain NEG-M]
MNNYQTDRLGAYRMCASHVYYPDREGMIKIALSHKQYREDNEVMTLLDVSTTQKKKIDCMVKAIWLSNICVLVVDVTKGVFEKDINNSIGNMRTHLQIAAAVGLTHLVVCLTKCDTIPVIELNSRLEEIRSKLKTILLWKNVPFIPICYDRDENIFKPTTGEFSKGKSLESVLKAIQVEPRKEWIEKPLMMVIFQIYRIGGIGTVVAGKIITGKIKTDQQVYFRDDSSHLVKSIEIGYEHRDLVVCGEFCGINIKQASVRDVETHFIIHDQAYLESEKKAVESFTALIKIMNQPKNGIKVGYTFKLYNCVTNQCLCKIEDILATVNPKTNQKLETYPNKLKKGDFAEVRLKPLITKENKACYLHTFEQNDILGRVILMNGKQIIGAGKVLRIN